MVTKNSLTGTEVLIAVVKARIAARSLHPVRDIARFLLRVRAGLTEAEIAELSWHDVLTPDGGRVAGRLRLPGAQDGAADGGGDAPRGVPLTDDLIEALEALRREWRPRAAGAESLVFSTPDR